jgi:predicted transposase/invertase (TIGR01784 family)
MAARIQFDDADDLIDICKDNVFKAVFTRDTPASQKALSRLVTAFIGYEVSILEIKENELPVDSLQERQIRYDIYCKAAGGEFINVEMSLHPSAFECVRMEYNAGKMFSGQELRGVGKSYNDLHRAYQITILGKERFFSDCEFFHSFEYYDCERRVSLGGRTRIITAELSKLERVVEKAAAEMSLAEYWAVFLKYIRDKGKRGKINEIIGMEEGIAMASEVLMTISRDEAEWFRRMGEEKYQLDRQSELVTAKREGMQEIINLIKSGKSIEEIERFNTIQA